MAKIDITHWWKVRQWIVEIDRFHFPFDWGFLLLLLLLLRLIQQRLVETKNIDGIFAFNTEFFTTNINNSRKCLRSWARVHARASSYSCLLAHKHFQMKVTYTLRTTIDRMPKVAKGKEKHAIDTESDTAWSFWSISRDRVDFAINDLFIGVSDRLIDLFACVLLCCVQFCTVLCLCSVLCVPMCASTFKICKLFLNLYQDLCAQIFSLFSYRKLIKWACIFVG